MEWIAEGRVRRLDLYYTISAELAAAVLLLLGVFSRYVSLYALPLMIAATHFWAVRRGFWFTDAGFKFPLAMLAVQALLGDGAFAVRGYPRCRGTVLRRCLWQGRSGRRHQRR